jgi:hypothetical protein
MTVKLDIRGVREERFEGFVYHQGASIRYERVEANNSCARTLIFGSFLLLSFVKFFFSAFFYFFDLAFYYLLSFLFDFYCPLFLLFRSCFIPIFFLCDFIFSLPQIT